MKYTIETPARNKKGWRRVPDTKFDTKEGAKIYGLKYHTDKYGAPMFRIVPYQEKIRKNPRRKNPRRKTKRAKPRRRVTAPRKTYRSAKKHTRKASTKRKSHQWEHVYETARKEGYREGDAIKIANGVIRRSSERVRKNPLKRAARKSNSFGRRTDPHIIEAIRIGPGKRITIWYFTGHSFEDKRTHALIYSNKPDALKVAKDIRNRVPDGIKALRVVHP